MRLSSSFLQWLLVCWHTLYWFPYLYVLLLHSPTDLSWDRLQNKLLALNPVSCLLNPTFPLGTAHLTSLSWTSKYTSTHLSSIPSATHCSLLTTSQSPINTVFLKCIEWPPILFFPLHSLQHVAPLLSELSPSLASQHHSLLFLLPLCHPSWGSFLTPPNSNCPSNAEIPKGSATLGLLLLWGYTLSLGDINSFQLGAPADFPIALPTKAQSQVSDLDSSCQSNTSNMS